MWFQHSKETGLIKGDSLKVYFMAKASSRKRKNKITSLKQEGRVITGNENILEYASSYYKELFSPVQNCASVALEMPLDDVLSVEDGEELVKPFTLEEVEKMVFGMQHNKAPGPDGLPIEFYQKFGKLIGKDVVGLFSDFIRVL